MQRLNIVTGDTPQITFSLTDKVTGAPIDLSDAQTVVNFKVRLRGTLPPSAEIECTKLPGREISPGVVSETPPYDVDGAGGRCRADCDANVFDTAGEWEAEVEVVFGASAQVMTVYDLVRITVREQF